MLKIALWNEDYEIAAGDKGDELFCFALGQGESDS